MKALFLILLLISFGISVQCQTVFYSEDFEGASPNWSLNTTDLGSIGVDPNSNQWLINNVYTGGVYNFMGIIPITIPNTPNEPAPVTGSPNSKYLHINYTPSAIYNANYVDNSITMAGGQNGSNFAKMNTDINTTGQFSVTLEFYWVGIGGAGKVYYSTNGGISWTQVGATYSSQSSWTLASIANVAFDNQPTLRFGFLFNNNVGGNDPPFSVDQIKVYSPSAGSPPVADFSSSDTTICVGSCIDFLDMSTNSPTSWTWTFTGATTPSSTTQNPVNICYNIAGTYTVELVASNAYGSDDLIKTNFITVVDNANASANTIGHVCESGGNVNLMNYVTGTAGGVWSGPNVTFNFFDPVGLTGDTIMLTYVAGAAGCSDTSSQEVIIDSASNPQWTVPGIQCKENMPLDLSAYITGDSGGTWFGTGVSGNNLVYLDDYSVAVTYVTQNGACLDSMMHVIMIDSVNAEFFANPSSGMTPLNVEFINYSENFTSSYWDFGNNNYSSEISPTWLFDSVGTYMVVLTVTSINGCVDTARHIIYASDDLTIYIPNVFTPNGDESNPVFKPIIGHEVEDFAGLVFNRWGNEIAQFDVVSGWDGTYHGILVASGVYYYVIKFDYGGQNYKYSGSVTVLY
ncbi:MAG: hypothetical protein CVU11_00605 [Bacteroidetes bacterium HGW-Bacteroidetes-6]|jgi:gliding motility-associated-like protein|nr:MAG: hypothetical protein CVU11_00605 [Bacteroidetes bacterium HGW-Bacteroidetes-6]